MNLYHIKLTDNQKAALEHLFSLDVTWNKTELEKAWDELREQVRESAQCVAIINALRDTECNCKKPTKYDPNREFRKGDKVSVRKIHGKLPQCRYNGMVKVKEGDCCTIHEKEHRNCYWVTIPAGGNWCFDAAYLELLTPVEAMGPYEVYHNRLIRAYEVTAVCPYLTPYVSYPYCTYIDAPNDMKQEAAKKRAEAECDRLNAEHRKEMEK